MECNWKTVNAVCSVERLKWNERQVHKKIRVNFGMEGSKTKSVCMLGGCLLYVCFAIEMRENFCTVHGRLDMLRDVQIERNFDYIFTLCLLFDKKECSDAWHECSFSYWCSLVCGFYPALNGGTEMV